MKRPLSAIPEVRTDAPVGSMIIMTPPTVAARPLSSNRMNNIAAIYTYSGLGSGELKLPNCCILHEQALKALFIVGLWILTEISDVGKSRTGP